MAGPDFVSKPTQEIHLKKFPRILQNSQSNIPSEVDLVRDLVVLVFCSVVQIRHARKKKAVYTRDCRETISTTRSF
jgi:hypothetical protein